MTQTHITTKQHTILQLLYRLRFLDRTHIQNYLNHKHHNRIILWLNELTNKNYIGRIYSPKFGENNKPAIYYLSKEGIKYLKATGDYDPASFKKLYRESQRDQSFIDLCLLLASIDLDLKHKTTKTVSYSFFVKSDYTQLEEKEALNELLPHGYLVQKKLDKSPTYLLDILDDDLPARQRIKRYISFYENNEWETGDSYPTILIVCPHERTQRSLARYIHKRVEELDPGLNMRLTTRDKVKQSGLASEIWQEID